MKKDSLLFQYCQKIVVLSKDHKKILLCKRQGEADYDGTFSFIGGKMEMTDESILDGLQREKDEEVGESFKINILPIYSVNLSFRKRDGISMILPHYLAIHASGEVELSNEYSEYKWASIDDLEQFEPKIPSIPNVLQNLYPLLKIATPEDYVQI